MNDLFNSVGDARSPEFCIVTEVFIGIMISKEIPDHVSMLYLTVSRSEWKFLQESIS